MRIGKQNSEFNYNVIQTAASGMDSKEILAIIGDTGIDSQVRLDMVQRIARENGNSYFRFNRREDTGEYLGVVSKDYAVVQNSELVNAVEEAFSLRPELGAFSRSVAVMGQGEKVAITYRFDSYTRKLAKVGDSVGFQLTIRNSFDRSWQASLIGGLMKLACLNGMTTLAKELALLQRHSSRLSLKFVGDMIQRAMEVFHKSTAHFDNLASVSITQAEGRHVIAYALEKYSVISTVTAQAVTKLWEAPTYAVDADRNLMNLYSAFTQHLRDETSYMKASRVGDTVAGMFRDAIRKADFLAEIRAMRDTAILLEA